MTNTLHAKLASTDSGGFTAIASTGSVDRDGEVVFPGCFAPLPADVPIHVDHNMTVAGLVGRGRPYYVGDQLRIDGVFGSGRAAQDARQKASEGILSSLSIVFRGLEWRTLEGVRTCVRGELLACDLVTIPSNPDTRVLAVRGFDPTTGDTRRAVADAMLLLARLAIADARGVPEPGVARQLTDFRLRRLLGER